MAISDVIEFHCDLEAFCFSRYLYYSSDDKKSHMCLQLGPELDIHSMTYNSFAPLMPVNLCIRKFSGQHKENIL
jgi:hypothetical protein